MAKNKIVLFNLNYFRIASLIFVTETLIALYIHDHFIRPYIGDVLVVILIYCFIKSFLNVNVIPTAVFVLLFSFGIEFLQHLNIVEKMGLQNSKIAGTVIGTSFSWMDILCYVIGLFLVITVEYYFRKEKLQ